jgi:hypothetical protein
VAQTSASSHDGAPPAAPPTFTAAVDRARGTIRVRGHLDRIGAEALLGTVGALRRLGHRHVTIALVPQASTDADADVLLGGLTRRVAAGGGTADAPAAAPERRQA